MSAFSRDLYFFRLGGPTRPAPRYAYGGLSCLLAVASKLPSVCLALTPSRRHRGVWIARRWPILPPGGAPPAHAWGPTSPHGLLFCLLQSHAIRAKGYLFDRLNRADVERHMLRSTKNGSRARRFPFANSSCHPWRDLRVPAMMDVSGVLGISAQLAGRIASW